MDEMPMRPVGAGEVLAYVLLVHRQGP
jgi:hypothetical protein